MLAIKSGESLRVESILSIITKSSCNDIILRLGPNATKALVFWSNNPNDWPYLATVYIKKPPQTEIERGLFRVALGRGSVATEPKVVSLARLEASKYDSVSGVAYHDRSILKPRFGIFKGFEVV
jgi:hypothetical protein